jgi:16S rRNA (cytidine1402-2'-O)-methyltransferase
MLEAGLYLIPTQLSEVPLERVLPAYNVDVVRGIRYYVVESLRSARRFLKKCDRSIDIDSLTFNELNEHTDLKDTAAIEALLEPIGRGEAVGVISDAGCPAVADPGADLVAIAQRRGCKVFPLVGPSSILMSLMASGFNGQRFAFEGYLPVDAQARQARLKEMTRRIERERQTQIFIEAPYRNNQLIADLAARLPGQLRLCVASDITGENQRIVTRPLAEWKQARYDYHKIPTIFLLYQ